VSRCAQDRDGPNGPTLVAIRGERVTILNTKHTRGLMVVDNYRVRGSGMTNSHDWHRLLVVRLGSTPL